jgi:hypothetical protein
MSIIRFHTASDSSPNDFQVTAAILPEDATEIDIRDFAGGGISVPDGVPTTTIWYYVATKPGGTYRLLHDRDDAGVEQIVNGGYCYPLPDEMYGFGAFRMVAGTAFDLAVSLKG